MIDPLWLRRPSLRHKATKDNLREFMSSSLGELVADFGRREVAGSNLPERSTDSDKVDLAPSSGIGKRLSGTPTAPSRVLKDLDAHAIHPDGRLVNMQTAKSVQPVDPEDPFAGESDEWHLAGNEFCEKLRAGPGKRASLERAMAARQDHRESSSTSDIQAARLWRNVLQSHQQGVLEVLQEMADVSAFRPGWNQN